MCRNGNGFVFQNAKRFNAKRRSSSPDKNNQQQLKF